MKNNKIFGLTLAQTFATAVLSAIFAYAGIIKIFDPSALRLAIEAYQIIGQPYSTIAAYYLPWVELLCAAGLWVRPLRAPASLLIAGMMSVFTLAVASAWARGISFSCGCFGESSGIDNPAILLIRDLLLLTLAAYLFITAWKNSKEG